MHWLLLLQSNLPGSFDTAIAIFFHLLFQKMLSDCEIASVVFVTFLNLRQAFGTIIQIATLLLLSVGTTFTRNILRRLALVFCNLWLYFLTWVL